MTKNELVNRGNISHKTNNAAIKARQSEELELATKAFLAKKGKVEIVDSGVMNSKNLTAKQINKATYDQDIINGKKKDIKK